MTGQGLLNDLIAIADKSASDIGTGSYRALGLVWLDYIIKDIQNAQINFRWRFLEKTATASTVVSQHTYDLPTDIDTNKMVSVYDRDSDVTYTFIPYERFVKFVADPSNNTGNPVIFTFFGKVLRLYPTPSSEFTFYLDYVKVLSDAADTATALDIPDKYKRVVMDGLLEYAYQFDSELGNAVNQRARYKDGLDRMIRDNSQMIAENQIPLSHRVKHNAGDNIDSKNSFYFPLEGTNF